MRAFRLSSHLVEKPWGGRRLAGLGIDLPDQGRFGEAWVVADLDPGQTVQGDVAGRIVDGPHAGRTLHELIESHRNELLGPVAPTDRGRFPLLVKHLDAAQHLSVQVHPPEALATPGSGWEHKTESWVVLEAEADAVLFLGVRDGVTHEDLVAALGTSAIVHLLRRVPARVGDVHHLPAGLVHALGAGVLVAEVQTPSDTTFRLYDWVEEYGRPIRELHLGDGRDSLAEAWAINISPPGTVTTDGRIVSTPHYAVDRIGPGTRSSDAGLPRVVMCLTGAVTVSGLEGPALSRGHVCVVPASWDTAYDVSEDGSVLEITVPA